MISTALSIVGCNGVHMYSQALIGNVCVLLTGCGFLIDITERKNSTTGADASGELMQLAEELANCNAVVCS